MSNILLFCSLFSGCSRTAKHKVLSFFFDEVPPLTSPERTAISDSLKQTKEHNTTFVDSTFTKSSLWFTHPSSNSSECLTCHDQTKMFSLYDTPENLCLKCHNEANDEIVHAPVEAGECISCHNPHGAPSRNLLSMEGKKLCFKCHEQKNIAPSISIFQHAPVKNGDCTKCHNPHASRNSNLLIVTEDALCLLCHDLEKVKPSTAKYIHAPVEDIACLDCHNPHGTYNPKLLEEPGQALCFRCHDENIKEQEKHEGIEETVCYECHDPHYSDNEYFIK